MLSIAISYYLSPHATPLVASILSLVFLSYGVYDHYRLFASEYRLSTWQDGWKAYAPFIMVGAILLYVLYGISSFFTGGSVPVPTVPSLESLSNSASGLTQSFSSTLNSIKNSASQFANQTMNVVSNAATNVANAATNVATNVSNATSNIMNNGTTNNGTTNNTRNNNGRNNNGRSSKLDIESL